MKQKKVVVFGSINVDIFYLKKYKKNKNIIFCPNSKEINTFILPGGKGANQAAVLAWLGAKTHMVGIVGDDEMGDWLLDILKSQKINVSRIKKSQKNPTPIVSILDDDKYSFWVSSGSNVEFNKKIIDDNVDLIKSADMVLVQLEIPINIVSYLADLCKKFNTKIMLNPDPKIKFNKEFFAKFDYITPNEDEMKEKDIQWMVDNTKSIIIQTKGKHGAIWHQKDNQKKHYKAKKYKVVSTIGAGDTFSATLSYYLIKDYTINDAIKKAIENSSWSIRQLGAQKLPKR